MSKFKENKDKFYHQFGKSMNYKDKINNFVLTKVLKTKLKINSHRKMKMNTLKLHLQRHNQS